MEKFKIKKMVQENIVDCRRYEERFFTNSYNRYLITSTVDNIKWLQSQKIVFLIKNYKLTFNKIREIYYNVKFLTK